MFNRESPPHEIIVELRVSFAVETLTDASLDVLFLCVESLGVLVVPNRFSCLE